jgi:hypothetical protein
MPISKRRSLPTSININNTNSTLAYAGGWAVLQGTVEPTPQHPGPYHITDVGGATVSLSFTNARAIAAFGQKSNLHGNYSVVRTTLA